MGCFSATCARSGSTSSWHVWTMNVRAAVPNSCSVCGLASHVRGAALAVVKVDERLAPLGTPPSFCTHDDVLAALRDALCATLASDQFEQPNAAVWAWMRETLTAQPEVGRGWGPRFDRSLLRTRLKEQWAAVCNQLPAQADSLIDTLVSDTFDRHARLPMNLSRFPRLRANVLQTATRHFGRARFESLSDDGVLWAAMLARGQRVAQDRLRELADRPFVLPALFSELIDIAFDEVLVPVVRFDFDVTAEMLEEDEQTTRGRATLQQRRDNVQAARQEVASLRDNVSPYEAATGAGGGGGGGAGGGAGTGAGGFTFAGTGAAPPPFGGAPPPFHAAPQPFRPAPQPFGAAPPTFNFGAAAAPPFENGATAAGFGANAAPSPFGAAAAPAAGAFGFGGNPFRPPPPPFGANAAPGAAAAPRQQRATRGARR
jgi:hypothetical protein